MFSPMAWHWLPTSIHYSFSFAKWITCFVLFFCPGTPSFLLQIWVFLQVIVLFLLGSFLSFPLSWTLTSLLIAVYSHSLLPTVHCWLWFVISLKPHRPASPGRFGSSSAMSAPWGCQFLSLKWSHCLVPNPPIFSEPLSLCSTFTTQ